MNKTALAGALSIALAMGTATSAIASMGGMSGMSGMQGMQGKPWYQFWK